MQGDITLSFHNVHLRYIDKDSAPDRRDQGDLLCRRRFDSAVVVGFMEKSGDLKINPPEEEGMPEGARVVALADDGMHTHRGLSCAAVDKNTGLAAHRQLCAGMLNSVLHVDHCG